MSMWHVEVSHTKFHQTTSVQYCFRAEKLTSANSKSRGSSVFLSTHVCFSWCICVYNDVLEQEYVKRPLKAIITFENGVYRHTNAGSGKGWGRKWGMGRPRHIARPHMEHCFEFSFHFVLIGVCRATLSNIQSDRCSLCPLMHLDFAVQHVCCYHHGVVLKGIFLSIRCFFYQI